MNETKRLYRSSGENKAILGVCGGIAEYFGLDPIIIRLLFVLVALVYGSGILVYLIAALIIPKKPEYLQNQNAYAASAQWQPQPVQTADQAQYYQPQPVQYASASASYSSTVSSPVPQDQPDAAGAAMEQLSRQLSAEETGFSQMAARAQEASEAAVTAEEIFAEEIPADAEQKADETDPADAAEKAAEDIDAAFDELAEAYEPVLYPEAKTAAEPEASENEAPKEAAEAAAQHENTAAPVQPQSAPSYSASVQPQPAPAQPRVQRTFVPPVPGYADVDKSFKAVPQGPAQTAPVQPQQPQQKQSKKGRRAVGIALVVIGLMLIAKVLFPRIDIRLVWGLAAVASGIYLFFVKN